MFPFNDPQTVLDLYHQRAGELARQAARDRLARESAHGRRRSGRWPRGRHGREPVQAPVTP